MPNRTRPTYAYLTTVRMLERLGAWCKCVEPILVENDRRSQVIVCQRCRGLMRPDDDDMELAMQLPVIGPPKCS